MTSDPSLTSFLGTCLDDAWVATMEAELGVSATNRDATGKLEHPFLHAAFQHPRFQVVDPRVDQPGVYGDCRPSGSFLMGVGSVVVNKVSTIQGRAKGTLVVDLVNKASQGLTSTVFAILAAEVVRKEPLVACDCAVIPDFELCGGCR